MSKQIAQLHYVRIAPRKVRGVAGILRGLNVNEAEAELLVRRERAARPLLKLLRSAVANAKQNQRLDPHALFVERIVVDQGPMLKRILPRARGIATPIQKKMSHVTLILGSRAEAGQSRFTIIVPKKVKLPSGEKRDKKERTKGSESESIAASSKQKSPGFFKRFFRRKSV